MKPPRTTLFNGTIAQPTMNVNAATQAARGMRRAAGGIADGVDKVADAAIRLEERKQAAELVKIETDYHRKMIEFDDWTRRNQDTSQWIGESQSVFNNYRSEIMAGDYSPAMKRQIENRLTALNNAHELRLQAKAGGVEAQHVKMTYAEGIRQAQASGDTARANALTDELAATGLVHESKIDRQRWEIEQSELKFGYMDWIDSEPEVALEALSNKEGGKYVNDQSLDIGTRIRLIAGAERRIEELKDFEMESMETGIADGTLTDEDIDTLPRYLNTQEKKALKAHKRRVTPPTEAEYSDAWEKLATLQALYKNENVSEAQYREEHRKVKADILSKISQDYTGDLKSALQYVSPAHKFNQGNPENFQKAFKKEAQMDASQTFTAALGEGTFGNYNKSESDAYNLKANRAFNDAMTDFNKWVNDQKDLTIEDVRAYTDEKVKLMKSINTPPVFDIPGQMAPGVLPNMDGTSPLSMELDRQLDE